MGGKHDIYIYDDPDNPGKTLARPCPAMVDRGKKLWVRNLTANPVELHFPIGIIKDQPPWVVPPHGRKGFDLSATADGYIPYQALMITKSCVHVALGNSGPSIIVDP